MLLIADGGATKTAWALLLPNDEPLMFTTTGFSPLQHSVAQIVVILQRQSLFLPYTNIISAIHYYGTGCISEHHCQTVRQALATVFPVASNIQIGSDVLSAARATWGNDKGIVAILGTGSIAALFDGKTGTIEQPVPALGYILGDEGSGSWLGKRLLADFFYRRLPEPLATAMNENPHLQRVEVLKQVYQNPNAKSYLASFAPLLHQYRQLPYVQQLIKEGFRTFLSIHILPFSTYQGLTLRVVGSVAHHFSTELSEVCDELRIPLEKVLSSPIHELVRYYQQYPL